MIRKRKYTESKNILFDSRIKSNNFETLHYMPNILLLLLFGLKWETVINLKKKSSIMYVWKISVADIKAMTSNDCYWYDGK